MKQSLPFGIKGSCFGGNIDMSLSSGFLTPKVKNLLTSISY